MTTQDPGPTTGCAVVTGGGSGLGAEIAKQLAREGYAVHVTDVDLEAANATASAIGGSAWASPLNVTDADACGAVAAATVERQGRLDVWVNNAGILKTGPSWATEPAARQALFDVNVHGTMNGTTAALEVMRPAGRGNVINVVSLAGLSAAPGETVYAATKHACLAYSVGTQMDLRSAGVKDIHISSLCPDGIWTPMLYDLADDPQAAPSWIGTMLQPADVARVAVGLVSKPRPVTAYPKWRGANARFVAAFPRIGLRLLPLIMATARRKQKAFAKQHTPNSRP
ncbi:MAG: SDR family NAD(P)-dependent oxidoreductase [Thermoleophilaceae bacterium]|nr:SDR family NAD(P)-dependent oxidoreductase [Thermoleophilaceae bacterium]